MDKELGDNKDVTKPHLDCVKKGLIAFNEEDFGNLNFWNWLTTSQGD